MQVHSLLRRVAQREKVELAVPHEQGRAGHQLLQEQVKLTIYCPDLKADSPLSQVHAAGVDFPDVRAARVQRG